MCGVCGFVPIGMGLPKLAPRRRPKGKFVEPGRLPGWVWLLGLGGVIYGLNFAGLFSRLFEAQSTAKQIIKDLGPIHGQSQIARVEPIPAGSNGVLAGSGVRSGEVSFDDQGHCRLVFLSKVDTRVICSRFQVTGETILLRDFRVLNQDIPIPLDDGKRALFGVFTPKEGTGAVLNWANKERWVMERVGESEPIPGKYFNEVAGQRVAVPSMMEGTMNRVRGLMQGSEPGSTNQR